MMVKVMALLAVLGLGACTPDTPDAGPPGPDPPLAVVGTLVASVDVWAVPRSVLDGQTPELVPPHPSGG